MQIIAKGNMNDKMLIYILKNYDELKRNLKEERLAIYSTVTDRDEVLESILLSGAKYKDIPFRNNTKKDVLFGALEREEQFVKEEALLLQEKIKQLTLQEEILQRVQICSQELPLEQREVIKRLYIDKEGFENAEMSMQVNHRIFLGIRKKAIRTMLQLYFSKYSNKEIIQKKYYIELEGK